MGATPHLLLIIKLIKMRTDPEMLAAIIVIVCIFQVILFFKLWRACDNIKRIADKYAPEDNGKKKNSETPETREQIDKWIKEDKL
jgi:hypothetical protein